MVLERKISYPAMLASRYSFWTREEKRVPVKPAIKGSDGKEESNLIFLILFKLLKYSFAVSE